MKLENLVRVALVVTVMSLAASSALGAGLADPLKFLQPLIGTTWSGGYVGDDAPDIEITLRFEAVLDGQAIKYTREAPKVGFVNETHIYWSPNRGEILFISLNSRGIVGEGVVEMEGDTIALRGANHWTDRSFEFETLLAFDPSGTLEDTFRRKENGEWVLGHVQSFERTESP